MLLLGIDIGTSSIKVSVTDAATQQCVGTAHYPETESGVIALQPGWAEQSPEMWWEHVQLAILKLHAQGKYDPKDIAAIGIAYQMHGLVMVDKNKHPVRNSIIWCDSRAVGIGDEAFAAIGKEKCLLHLLNSPGNFTASKLAWVKHNERAIYEQADKVMLPGDFIAMKLTGEITTSISALSEGIFWDFQQNEISTDVMSHYGFCSSLIPEIKNVFAEHGRVTQGVAAALSLKKGIPVSYKAGDQPNNALSLNVLQPGEVAATAGTSGVIYGVTDRLTYDNESRLNTFAHVNHQTDKPSLGVLLCINGTGILYNWVKSIAGNGKGYAEMNEESRSVKPGSDGLSLFPFGNGAERILTNKTVGAHINHIDFNKHSAAHLFRAAQEGIAFAFRYGLDLMKENGMSPNVIRAGHANMFLSDVFTESFVNTLDVPVAIYNNDGSSGASIGAGLGAKIYSTPQEAFHHNRPLKIIEPVQQALYNDLYERWHEALKKQLN